MKGGVAYDYSYSIGLIEKKNNIKKLITEETK